MRWSLEPEEHADVALSGNVGGKLADPSGNGIEVKSHPDVETYRSATSSYRTATSS